MFQYIKEENEHSSVLASLKQITPSDRTGISDCGVGDRSDVGKTPAEGQSRIWGNLDKQSKGMTGEFDTQGKDNSTMFTSHKNSAGSEDTGTYTPKKYRAMLREEASGDSTGVSAGRNKVSAASGSASSPKYKQGADTAGRCCCGKTHNTMTESFKIGSALSIAALNLFNEMYVK